jgi:hypothetical protein
MILSVRAGIVSGHPKLSLLVVRRSCASDALVAINSFPPLLELFIPGPAEASLSARQGDVDEHATLPPPTPSARAT